MRSVDGVFESLLDQALTTADHARCCAAVADRFGISALAVHELVTFPQDALVGRYHAGDAAVPNAIEHPATVPLHPIGSVRVAPYCSVIEDRYVDVLEKFKARDLITVEAEQNIRSHPSYPVYTEWARRGSQPPYINVFETESGRLQSTNRRRTLVAQDLGLEIVGWLGKHNSETGLPLKYGDVVGAYRSLERDVSPATVVYEKPLAASSVRLK